MNQDFSILSANQEYASRQFNENEDISFRTKFVRDRDRILYSKEFRRLQGKTQDTKKLSKVVDKYGSIKARKLLAPLLDKPTSNG